jgi:acyl-CoA reductase-like NAD-dependent aldehyde dehydrogenase
MARQANIKHPRQLFIGGRWINPATTAQIEVLDSSAGEVFARVAEAAETDVARAVEAARQAFDEGPWPRMSVQQRAGYLQAIAAELNGCIEDRALALTCESGAVASIAQMLVHVESGIYAEHAALADRFQVEERRPTSPFSARAGLLVREPVGVVAAIVPWNMAGSSIAAKAAPALLTGCTLVVKAAPEAPVSGYILAEICERIGLPPGVLNVVTAGRDVSEALVRHPGVDMVAFTGSTAAGKRIASLCGERIARYHFELGGKSPAVILDDFDLAVAAERLAQSARLLTGQVCASLTRFIVTEKRHDDFVEALVASFGATRVGDPFDPSTEMGPLAMRRQRERVEGYIAKGKSGGAKLATGGGRPPHLDRGWFIEPTIFADVDRQAAIAREEIFGPVLCVIPAKDEDEAVRIANDTNYGLNASVFTNDIERAYRISRTLRSGTVGHNAMRSDPGIGFGGFKQSGVGREGGGLDGLSAYIERKTVLLEAFPSHLSA